MSKNTANLTNFNPDPTDLPGYPTYADVHAAMSRDGDRADHDLWAKLNSAWDAVAWATGYSLSVPQRRQEAYEVCARVLAAYRAGKATATPRPAPAKPAAKGVRRLYDCTQKVERPHFGERASAYDRYERGLI